MKKLFLGGLVSMFIFDSGHGAMANETLKSKKVLIAYYSKTGSTEEIAKTIQKNTGGDIFLIEPTTPYPTDIKITGEQSKKEIEAGVKPPIKSGVPDIAKYDVVFVGSPCWWATIAPPVATFLSQHNLTGKTIIPFITHGGSGMARSAQDIAKLAPAAKVIEGKAFSGTGAKTAAKDVEKWLKGIKELK